MTRQEGTRQRLATANKVIRLIAAHGRKFFDHTRDGGTVSQFELSPNGRLWFIDGYTKKRVFVMYRLGRWDGFTEGGTLRALICNLADHIVKGSAIRNAFGPWHESLCEGDLWGYGKEEMALLRHELRPYVPALGTQESEAR